MMAITEGDSPLSCRDFANKLKKDGNGRCGKRLKKGCEIYRIDSNRLKTPEEVRKMTDLTGERTFAWELVRENGRRAWLRTYDDPMNPFPTEAEISAAMKRMVMELPKIGLWKDMVCVLSMITGAVAMVFLLIRKTSVKL